MWTFEWPIHRSLTDCYKSGVRIVWLKIWLEERFSRKKLLIYRLQLRFWWAVLKVYLILEEENTERPLGDPQSKDPQPNGPMSLQAEGSVKTQLATGNSDIHNEALAQFYFKSNFCSSVKGKAQILKPQSKKLHHPYQAAKRFASSSKKLAISNGEGEKENTTSTSMEGSEQPRL
ncbi:hypothetical protein LIER_41669 [Lithospermum erythrorhizon]|uniref:Uncharacterized protein n=1 Tax=Lithospermum erythrorhizon TaxID=34254 RepID=A0AAV3RE47_LITER